MKRQKCLEITQEKQKIESFLTSVSTVDSENTIKFDPPVYRQRYSAVYQTLIDERWRTKITKLCDFGCAEFGLFIFIKQLNRLTDILFIDIDEFLLKEYVRKVHPLTIEYLKRREEPLTVSVFSGSVGDPDYRILNTDVVTAIELIEHLYPDTLEAVPYNIFNYVEPKLVIVTTPNADFNVLFSKQKKFRHYDHKFEWTREQFQDWANNIVIRFPDYEVIFSGIGEGPESTNYLGHCSQMALFIRKDLLNDKYLLEKYLTPCICSKLLPCKALNPSPMACKCVCPLCLPNESYGICTYSTLSKQYIDSEKDGIEHDPSLNIFYKAVEKIEYPFERDNRSEEDKMMDEFRYRINTFGHSNSRFFVEERDRAEIPLVDLLYGSDSSSITESELGNLLTKHEYQIEKCLIPETNELETCVVLPLLMDNVTGSSDSSDYDSNSGYFQSVTNESLSDWDETEKEGEAGSGTKEKSKEEHFGPSTNSADPAERKLARKLRLENRLAFLEDQARSPSVQKEEKEKLPVELQVEKSAGILEQFLHEGETYVSNVLKANNIRRTERRRTDDATKDKILNELEDQAAEAEHKFNEIASKWSDLKGLNDPLQINEAILHQKSKCDELILLKDEFIKKLKSELVIVDKTFQDDLLKFHEDIEILSQRIEIQIQLIKRAFQKQFNMIDKVVHMEKDKFITLHNDIWEELYQKYTYNEKENCELKIQQQEEIKEKIEMAQFAFEEKLRLTRTTWDHDVQFTQLELEKIKALIMLNLEKFDYHFNVLESRENENMIIKAQQKRRVTKLKDHVAHYKKELHKCKSESGSKIKKLQSEIAKLKKHIIDVETKADYFTTANDSKFHQVWNMNRKHVLELLNKIFTTDKILQQQTMGLIVNTPLYKNIDKHLMPSYQQAINILNKIDREASNKHLLVIPKGSTVSVSHESKKQEVPVASSDIEIKDSNRSYRTVVRHLLMLLSDKTGFLTEKRIKCLLNRYEDNNATLIRLDNVFESFKINKQEDIDVLISYFLRYCYCKVCSETYHNQSSDLDPLHGTPNESESQRINNQTRQISPLPKSPAVARNHQVGLQNPPIEEEETDLFEETPSTPSLSSQDNKVHLKRASTIEKTGFIPPPAPPLDVNKMKIDFNRINELDRVRNIPLGRNFFGHLLRPQPEKLRKSYLRERDCLPGPSNLPPRKRKRMRMSAMTSDSEDDVSPLEDMKSVTNCIVENTLNMLNVDDVKANKDDVIEFNIPASEEPAQNPEQSANIEIENNNNDNILMEEGNADTLDLQNVLDEIRQSEVDDENYNVRQAVDLSSIERCPNLIYASALNVPSLSVPVSVAVLPNVPIPLPMSASVPVSQNISIGLFEYPQDNLPLPNGNYDQEERNQEFERISIAQASREAIVDPNEVQDLLEDMDIDNSLEELNGVDIVDLGNVILVGIHPLSDIDGQGANGFPNWLLQILGTQVPMSEGPMEGTLEEPHYYCQGDGLGVHPSVVAVDVDEEDEQSTQSSNTTDFAEVDPGLSSQDMSSLPEDSLANTATDIQDPLEENEENDDQVPTSSRAVTNIDSSSSSSDAVE